MPLYSALICAHFCPSPFPITGFICCFSQPAGPLFVPLFSLWYHYPIFTKCLPLVTWSFIILNLLPFYLLLHRSYYALFLNFSDLVLVSGMLPSVLQTPLLFHVLPDFRTSPALLLELLSLPQWSHNKCGPLQTFVLGPCQVASGYQEQVGPSVKKSDWPFLSSSIDISKNVLKISNISPTFSANTPKFVFQSSSYIHIFSKFFKRWNAKRTCRQITTKW